MADEAADREVFEAARAVPGPLVVGVEDVAVGVEADAAGRADTTCGRDEFAVGADLAPPAAKLDVGGKGAGQAQRDPDVAVLVEARAEGIFVIVAADFPTVGNDLEGIGPAFTRAVFDARD